MHCRSARSLLPVFSITRTASSISASVFDHLEPSNVTGTDLIEIYIEIVHEVDGFEVVWRRRRCDADLAAILEEFFVPFTREFRVLEYFIHGTAPGTVHALELHRGESCSRNDALCLEALDLRAVRAELLRFVSEFLCFLDIIIEVRANLGDEIRGLVLTYHTVPYLELF
jgi:hypothetical protein